MVSVTPIEGAQGHAAFSGDTAVIANGERGLTLLDVSNPASPRIRLATQDFGVCVGVEMRSDTLACVANAFALILVDLSDLDHPREIARYAEPNGIAAIQLLDDTVYIGAYSQIYGAQNFVDISDPRQPRVVGSAPIRPLLIGRSGQYACSFYDGLSIIDLKAPAHPQSMSHTAVLEAQKIALHGRDALLSASGGELKVFDIANASQPIRKGELSAVQPNLFVRRDYAYAVGNSFQIVDLADPSNPRILSTLPEPGQCVVAFGKYAYIVSSKTFLTVISVTNALSPVVVRRVPVFGTALAAANGFLYSTRLNGLTVFDLSDPTAPRNVAAFTRLGDIFQNDIAISGSLLCMVGHGGFQIFDISNPQRVWLLAQLDYVTGQRVAIAGNHAYVLNSQGGLQSVDISSPGHPKVVGGNATLRATGLAVSEDTVYVVGPQGLTILDHYYQPNGQQSLLMLSPIDPTSARVRVRGPSGQTARIQRSNTFSDWTDWQTISLGDASQDVLDREIASAKYYRTVSP